MSSSGSFELRKTVPVFDHSWTDEEYRSMSIKLVTSGDVSRLSALVNLWAADQGTSTSSQSVLDHRAAPPGARRLLAAVRDKKGRTLLHLAARSVQPEMIEYLIESGCPTNEFDHRGNTVIHALLQKLVKRTRSRKRKHSTLAALNYVECCRLVQRILNNNPDLLTVSNDRGQKSTQLLQRLWDTASEEERMLGDKILTSSFSSCGVATGSEPAPLSNMDDLLDRDEYDSFSEHWYDGNDDGNAHVTSNSYAWEEYFSGFTYTESRSHLDTIREEYERRHQYRIPCSSKNLHPSGSTESMDRNRQEFLQRHTKALSKRKCLTGETKDFDLDTFKLRWSSFESDTSEIRRVSTIPWPPFCGSMSSSGDRSLSAERRIQTVLRFVNHKPSQLRQLQIQWHPDRFASRVAQRLHSDIKNSVMQKVNAISQLLNTAMDTLRQKDHN